MGDLPPYQPVPIGEFRYRVTLATEKDVQDKVSGKSKRTYVETSPVHAAIIPVGTQYFWEQYNTENEVTHAVYLHYRTDAHTYDRLIQRVQIEQGRVQKIVYEVQRTTDFKGMKRFLRFDVKVKYREIE